MISISPDAWSFWTVVIGAAFGYGGAWTGMKLQLKSLLKDHEQLKREYAELKGDFCRLRERMGVPFTSEDCRESQDRCQNVVCNRITQLEKVISDNHKYVIDLFLQYVNQQNGGAKR